MTNSPINPMGFFDPHMKEPHRVRTSFEKLEDDHHHLSVLLEGAFLMHDETLSRPMIDYLKHCLIVVDERMNEEQ